MGTFVMYNHVVILQMIHGNNKGAKEVYKKMTGMLSFCRTNESL